MESFRLALPDVKGASVTVHGAHGDTVVSASAYDVPRFMEVMFDRSTRMLRIEFGYPDREEASSHEVEKGFFVLLGINSGKLLGFVVKDIASKPGGVVVQLANVVGKQLQQATRINQRLNYQTILGVVQERAERALAAVGSA